MWQAVRVFKGLTNRGAMATVPRASDPREAWGEACSTPTQVPTGSTGLSQAPEGLAAGATHPGQDLVGETVLVCPDVGRSQGKPTRSCVTQGHRSPKSKRQTCHVTRPDALHLGHARWPDSLLAKASGVWLHGHGQDHIPPWGPPVPHLGSEALVQTPACSHRDVDQEIPAPALAKTRAAKHLVKAQQNHSFSRAGGETLRNEKHM